MATDTVLALKHPHPGESVRIGPDRVEDSGEVDIDISTSVSD